MSDAEGKVIVRWRTNKNGGVYSRRHIRYDNDARTACGTRITTVGSVEIGGEVDCLACTDRMPKNPRKRLF